MRQPSVEAPLAGARALGVDGGAVAARAFVDAAYPHSHDLTRMEACSPLRHARGVRAATMLMLGQKDRRVPASQGSELFYALKALQREAAGGGPAALRALSYPEDTHALDKPATEADAWVNVALWLAEHAGPGAKGP